MTRMSGPRWLPGLSIGARLALGFGMIAILFLIANYFSQQNAASVTTRIEASNRASRNLDRAARSLTETLTAVHRTVRELIAVDRGSDAQKDYLDARAALVKETDAYALLHKPIPHTLSAASLTTAVQSLQGKIDALVGIAKRRDDSIKRYWTDFERLQDKLMEPQHGVWRIGDRTFARTSVATVVETLQSVRNAVDVYLALPSARRASMINLQEENFLVALAKNSKAMAAAKDEAWVAGVRTDFEALRRQQRNLRLARDNTQAGFLALSANIDELLATVHSEISEPAAQALVNSAQLASEIAHRADRNIAFLSVGTLTLTMVILLLTAKSVTSPVSHLIQATRRLARGDAVTPVKRGGVRELDQLAGAFNDMASQLAEAKRGVLDQQVKLEERVVERTLQLQHMAYHDSLTQMPNRRHLFKHLNSTLEQARRDRHSVALLLLDLDNFKTLNDSLGHLFGDRVLEAISRRLNEVVATDGFAARLGGDEFTIVRQLHPHGESVAKQMEQLLQKFQQPLRVDEREIMVGLSIGAGIFPDHAQDAESLLRAADGALFRAKALGRNQTCIASPELIEQISAQFRIEQALRRAIQCNELELLYQPQVCLNSHEVTSVEALLRWKRGGDYISPMEFLPLAEQSGLITEITDWVLERAVQTVAEWRRGPWPEARVAVNISPQQFSHHMFVGRLQALLVSHNVPAASLELELTETVLQNGAATVRTLKELRELGVSIALDDFGAGYSSFASLEQLQLSRVKIDRSLIENVDKIPRSAQVARAMISLCRLLDLRVTAEGVERAEQLRFLYQCDDVDVQGFLLARPLLADRVVAVCSELPNFLASTLEALREKNRNPPSSVSYLHRRGSPGQN